MPLRITSLFLILLLVSACTDQQKEITLIYSVNEPMGKMALTIRDVLQDELDIKVNTVIGKGSIKDLKQLQKGNAELTLVENYLDYIEDIKVLLPVYPQLLHVLYKSEDYKENLESIIKGQRVYIGDPNETSFQFIIDILEFYDLPPGTYTIQDNPFDVDAIVGFTDIIKDEYFTTLPGFKIFSFDHVDRLGKGSQIDALVLKYPKLQPFIIPQQTYSGYTNESILTVYHDILLVTNENLDEDLAYSITKTLYGQSQRFNDISPLVHKGFKENFDRMELNVPLHEGARVYLDRDEPSFLEKNAEVIGLIFSIIIAVVSGGYTLAKITGQKKKDKIDVFYEDLLKIRNRIPQMKTLAEIKGGLQRIKKYRNKAFQMLVDEELMANESFRIYMELSKETSEELKVRYRSIAKS